MAWVVAIFSLRTLVCASSRRQPRAARESHPSCWEGKWLLQAVANSTCRTAGLLCSYDTTWAFGHLPSAFSSLGCSLGCGLKAGHSPAEEFRGSAGDVWWNIHAEYIFG